MKYLLLTITLIFTSTAHADIDSKHGLCKSYSKFAEITANSRDTGIPQSTVIDIVLKGSPVIREAAVNQVLAIYHQTYLTKLEIAEKSYNFCMRSTADELKTLNLF